jgi:Neuraminidase (sialidase)
MEPFLCGNFKSNRNIVNTYDLLCITINAIPDIEVADISIYDNKIILFLNITINKITKEQGLFFLVRCIDRRYFRYDIELKVTCMDLNWENGDLPIVYELHIESEKYATIQEKVDALIENMNDHINHRNFIDSYDIDLSRFKIRTLNDVRDEKIKEILDGNNN